MTVPFVADALNAGASGIRDEIPFSLSQEPPLELAAELVRMLAPVAAQMAPEVFVGLALSPLHDRAEQPPPERSLASFPCRGEERGRKCLQCHGGLLVSRLPPIRSEPLAARGAIARLRTPRAAARQDGISSSLPAQGCDGPEIENAVVERERLADAALVAGRARAQPRQPGVGQPLRGHILGRPM